MNTKQFQQLLNKLTHLDGETKLLALNIFVGASAEKRGQLVEFFLNQNQKLDLLYQKFGKKVKESIITPEA